MSNFASTNTLDEVEAAEQQAASHAKMVQAIHKALQRFDQDFSEKLEASRSHAWCEPVSLETKVETVQSFYKDFHNEASMPIANCQICARKVTEDSLTEVDARTWEGSCFGTLRSRVHRCRQCFPEGEGVAACPDCVKSIANNQPQDAAIIHTLLGCEHVYPPELSDLTAVEERTIALNAPYGYLSSFRVSRAFRRRELNYPRHVKGHITVFPNNVEDLATRVLPHPLVRVMQDIHVSWQGPDKPLPEDLSTLLSVRPAKVRAALKWLIENNHLYQSITIDEEELASWNHLPSGVPASVYDDMERHDPSAQEQAQTGHVVPGTERDDPELNAGMSIDEVIGQMENVGNVTIFPDNGGTTDDAQPPAESPPTVFELDAAGMFALDERPRPTLLSQLDHVRGAVDEDQDHLMQDPEMELDRPHGYVDPVIRISRGSTFADGKDPYWFPKIFPTLFPFGVGSNAQVLDKAMTNLAKLYRNDVGEYSHRCDLLHKISLETWVKVLLSRRGGRFARHPIFAFLVFNMLVRFGNGKISMGTISRKSFEKFKQAVGNLTPETLREAEEQLEATGKCGNENIDIVLRELEVFGFKQPMSREDRVAMRTKIRSLMIRHGLPAIWFTINPNDIRNPVKLKLAAHRTHETDEAVRILTDLLNDGLQRTRLSMSDPVSAAIFFHREISCFFKHYTPLGQDGVFGRVNQYFGAVETNSRGALHLHGLLWLHGNTELDQVLVDANKPDAAAYREAIETYVDSVFKEVGVALIHL